MPDLTPEWYQKCTADKYEEINVSSSRSDMAYTTTVEEGNAGLLYNCTCPGYQYRGKCKHVTTLMENDTKPCGWHQLYSDEQQTPQQEMSAECPKCGGPTDTVKVMV